jgi:hypothetical protein
VLHILRPSSPVHMASFSRSGTQLVSGQSAPYNRQFLICFRFAAATTTQPEYFLAAVATK